MSKTTLIIDNIITPYIIARYNAISSVLDGKLEVWFQAKTDINREWQHLPEIKFKYQFLEDHPVRLVGTDVTTFHINLSIFHLLAHKKNELKSVIICGWDSLTYWYTVWFCRQHRIPLTLWSGSTINERSWRRTLFLPIIKWVVKSANDYIAYGTRAKSFLLDLGASSQDITIFINSIDVEFFVSETAKLEKKRRQIRKKLGFHESDFVFIYVGQLIERKGIADLVAAYRLLAKIQPNIRLLIAGTGPLEPQLKAKLSSFPALFVGHIEYQNLPQLYVAADTFVLPSHEEVWGLVVNEALASGVPVIVSSSAGSAPDLVIEGKNGYTYPSGSVSVLSEKMALMLGKAASLKIFTRITVKKSDPVVMAREVFHAH